MHRFWQYIIEPILTALRPGSIVEIGCGRGLNTNHLLEFCDRYGAILHAIDPHPEFEISTLEEKYRGRFRFYKALSLDALKSIDSIDAVLVDGDHNWYTVFNELCLIKQQSLGRGRAFPVVLLHDVDWPYGRRDMYYDPATILEKHRKPFKKAGLLPNNPGLVDEGGLNADLYNAVNENAPRSGVLTAVEDFLSLTEELLSFVKIPGFHGLGVLCSHKLREQNGEVAQLIDSLSVPPALLKHVSEVEYARLISEAERISQAGFLQKAERDISRLSERVAETEQALVGAREQLASAQASARIEASRASRFSQDVDRLAAWIDELQTGVSSLLSSRRWRIGNALGECFRVISLKPRMALVTDYLTHIFKSFDAWRSGHRRLSTADNAVSNGASEVLESYPSVDIIVCVHNALDHTRACLTSIIRNTVPSFTLYIVNDGSNQPTTSYLREFAEIAANAILLDCHERQGYTRAANRGLRASTADYVVLLNSDTVVPPHWLERLLECAQSDENIGIVGPVSNAASWQSVPHRFDGDGEWMVNELPPAWDVNDMAELVNRVSDKSFPRVPLLNGFCLLIKRRVLEQVGYLDEDDFPNGYGEENDFCVRTVAAGFELAVADHLYVFHAKSRSYGHQQRKELSNLGGQALQKKHGRGLISELLHAVRDNPVLAHLREKLTEHLSHVKESALPRPTPDLRILYLLPIRGGGGGVHSVIQEAMGMRQMGVNARVAVHSRHLAQYRETYGSTPHVENLFLGFCSRKELLQTARSFDVVIATVFHSCKLLKEVLYANPNIMPAYYVQDYEPWFFEQGSPEWQEAKNSYELVEGCVLFAKTQWLANLVKEKHGVEVHRVVASVDHDVYFPKPDFRQQEPTVTIAAMVRPSTPRRAPARTMRLLKRLKQDLGDQVEVHTFGCEDDDPGFLALDRSFSHSHHGVLTRELVGNLLRQSDVFIDVSDYQAFGRTGLEAMACGCAVVLPIKGGTNEYAVDQYNAILVDTTDEEQIYNEVRNLIEAPSLRAKLRENGLQTAEQFTVRRAAASVLALLDRQWVARGQSSTDIEEGTSRPIQLIQGSLRVAALLSQRVDGKPAGSAYIRVIKPLTHPRVRDRIKLIWCKYQDLYDTDTDLILVQRNSIDRVELARELLVHCRRRAIPLVLELDDDLFDAMAYRERVGRDPSPGMVGTLRVLASGADAVIVSSPLLERTLRVFNDRVYCLPNALDEEAWSLESSSSNRDLGRGSAEKPVGVVYVGTPTHAKDLSLVEPVVEQLRAEYGERLTFDLVGGVPPGTRTEWNVISLPHGSAASDSYLEFVAWLKKRCSWDIGIIPLQEDSFNRKKSFLKFLDYSALGLASICTDIDPYREVVKHGVNGLLVDNSPRAWLEAIKHLVEDTDSRKRIAANAFDDLMQSHVLRVRASEFARVYEEIASLGTRTLN